MKFLKVNKNLFYHVIILYSCKEGLVSYFMIVRFETCSTLKEQNYEVFRVNPLLIPLKYKKKIIASSV